MERGIRRRKRKRREMGRRRRMGAKRMEVAQRKRWWGAHALAEEVMAISFSIAHRASQWQPRSLVSLYASQ